MRSRMTQFALVISVLFASGPSSALTAHWTVISVKPEAIVIGEIVRIESPAFEVDSRMVHDGSRVMRIFATGQVRADTALWGTLPVEPVALCWDTGSRLDPSVPDKDIWLSSSKTFTEGERKIWVIWPLGEVSSWGVGCDRFQAYHIDELNRVKADIAKYLKD